MAPSIDVGAIDLCCRRSGIEQRLVADSFTCTFNFAGAH